ncbi:MAG: ComEC/Rec2 family competence protein, partial [Flavobacterium sp.]
MNIVHFPLFKWAMGFIAGIVLAYQVPLSLSFSLGLAVISLLFFGVAYFFTTKNLGKRWFFDVTSLWLSVVLGMNVLTLHTESNDRLNYSRHVSVFEKPSWIAVVVQQKLKSNAFSDRYVASIRTINEQEQTGSIIININKNKLSKGIEVGTPLRFLSVLVKTSLSKNPYQFDYSIYLKNKQIYAQVYLDPEEITYQVTPEKSLWFYAANVRKIIVAHLQESGFDSKALPVAMALILGQQQDIDPNITKDYQYAGAVHILSVSGLHIGSIVFFIHFLLRPIPNTKRGRFLKLVISLSMLLVFGVLAGLAASVVRSITMFSIIAIGQYLNRSTSIFHTLVVSMLLILLFQPYFLFDVGFQLSYAALFFIVWLQPMLQALWAPKNKIIRFFWNIMTVSLAAQLGTFPLSVFYFHQFPGLFFITNLLVLPLIGVIMFLGVVVMLVAVFGIVPVIIYKPLEYGILFMNAIIHKVASFENFIFTNIPFNSYLLVASFVLIFALVFWLKKITFIRTVMVLMAILVFQICFFVIRSEYEATQEW